MPKRDKGPPAENLNADGRRQIPRESGIDEIDDEGAGAVIPLPSIEPKKLERSTEPLEVVVVQPFFQRILDFLIGIITGVIGATVATWLSALFGFGV